MATQSEGRVAYPIQRTFRSSIRYGGSLAAFWRLADRYQQT